MRYIPSLRGFAFSSQAALIPSWSIDFSTDSILYSGGYDYNFSAAKTVFSQGSNINKTGLVELWIANELLNSENLNANAANQWNPILGTTLAIEAASPIGTTAYRFTHNSTSSTSNLNVPDVSNTLGVLRTMSLFVKYVNTQWVWMQNDTGNSDRINTTAAFDILNGTTGGALSQVADYGIESAGNSWYRIWISSVGTQSNSAAIRLIRGGTGSTPLTTNITYNGTEAFDLWGGQVNRGLYQPYSPTTTTSNGIPKYIHDSEAPYTKLGLYVQEQSVNQARANTQFDSVAWTKTNTQAITNLGITGPDGVTSTVDLIVASDTTTNDVHTLQRNGVNPGNFSIFLKAGNTAGGAGRCGRYGLVTVLSSANVYFSLVVDLTTGEITTTSSNGTMNSVFYNVQKFNDGWYRIWITTTAYSTARFGLITNDSNGNPTLGAGGETFAAGNTSDGIYAWGAGIVSGNNPPPTYTFVSAGSNTTEPADLVYVDKTNIGNIGNSGAFVVQFYNPQKVGTIIATDNQTNSMLGIEMGTTFSARAFWTGNTSFTESSNLTTGLQKACVYWEGTTGAIVKFSLNGGEVSTGASDLNPSNISFVSLGARATATGGTYSDYANVTIKEIDFYSGYLSDTQIRKLTT
jgi:hypothetical protein